ncbi:MAG: hypothetical protein D3908_01565, partial [Candidatus Electrothrix sp. AUS4]|nr:hypothetical protein [Candidatus Electrothrix sp. AUS4]
RSVFQQLPKLMVQQKVGNRQMANGNSISYDAIFRKIGLFGAHPLILWFSQYVELTGCYTHGSIIRTF